MQPYEHNLVVSYEKVNSLVNNDNDNDNEVVEYSKLKNLNFLNTLEIFITKFWIFNIKKHFRGNF